MKCQRHKLPCLLLKKILKIFCISYRDFGFWIAFPSGILDFGSLYLSSCFPHKSGSELRRSMLWSLKVNRVWLSEAFLSGKEKKKNRKYFARLLKLLNTYSSYILISPQNMKISLNFISSYLVASKKD